MPLTLVNPAQPSSIGPNEHTVIAVIRNESLRLPYFLTHYRTIGFKHFIMIDNGSSDGTREFLLEQPDVILFETKDSFRGGHCGALWATALLNAHCQDRWALVVDADELLIWPGSEHESIGDLTRRLDKVQARSLFVIMIDMYSDKPFGSVGYVRGEPLLEAAPFFDREPYAFKPYSRFPHRLIYGGPRGRAFPALKDGRCNPPTNSKVPLVRWQPGQSVGGGQHTLAVPVQLAPMRGAILHFKMLDDAPARCEREFARGEHWGGAREQRALALMIEQAPNRCFFDPSYSVRYVGTHQLVTLGLMHEQDPFGALEPYPVQSK